jgi:hypothetical protein
VGGGGGITFFVNNGTKEKLGLLEEGVYTL